MTTRDRYRMARNHEISSGNLRYRELRSTGGALQWNNPVVLYDLRGRRYRLVKAQVTGRAPLNCDLV